MSARHRSTGRITASAIVLACLALPACGKSSSTPQPSASTSPTPDAAAAARQAVLTAYGNRLTAYYKISARGYVAATDDPVLKQYVVNPDLSELITGLKYYAKNNVVSRGTPTWTGRVTALNLDANPASAALQVCQDLSHYKSVDKTTGENLSSPNQLRRFKIAATAQRINGRWFINQATAQRKTPC